MNLSNVSKTAVITLRSLYVIEAHRRPPLIDHGGGLFPDVCARQQKTPLCSKFLSANYRGC
ncbi:MAG: hypothetical protein R2911_14340 [Caldilineaceae bacterium]